MKNSIKILLVCSLVIAISNVTFASDVGVHKVSKTESILTAASFYYTPIAITNDNGNGGIFVIDYVTILPEALPSLSGSITYLKNKKPIYKSPDVDRKWVWFYSLITNS